MIHELGELHSSDGSTLLKMWKVSVQPGVRPLVRHSHIRFEITLITSGSGIYTVGDMEYPIKPDSIFVFASNEQHCITKVDENGLEMINLHFEPRYLWGRSFDSLSAQNADFCFRHSPEFCNYLSPERSTALKSLFIMMTEEFSKKPAEYALQIKNYLNMIIISLIRSFNYSSDNVAVSRDRLNSVKNTIKYIDTHLSEPITLQMLAENAGMTPNYFSTLFKKISGITLWDYINSRRIEATMQLLKGEKQLNILEIATQCGFNNTANFNKIFKKVSGLTPKEYRASGDIIV